MTDHRLGIAAAGVALPARARLVDLHTRLDKRQIWPCADTADGTEVSGHAVRIAHLDRPVGVWPAAVTRTPAAIMVGPMRT